MHASFLFAFTTLFTALVAAAPPADHLGPAPPGRSHEDYHYNETQVYGPPGHVNNAPYGHAHTYFEGFAEGQALNKTLTARSVEGVYTCSEENWHGQCSWQVASGGLCHPYTYGRFSSFGPDKDIICWLFQGPHCGQAQSRYLLYPGTAHVEDIIFASDHAEWTPLSFQCRWKKIGDPGT